MGTSKGNSGPKRGTPIIPDWADNNDNNSQDENANNDNQGADEPKNQPVTGNFGAVRRSFSSYLNAPSGGRLKGAVRSYIGASGGSKEISASAVGGKRSASRFVGFLSDVVHNGTQQAFRKLGINNLQDLSAVKAFTELANFLSPSTNLVDEPYARSAISEALSKMFEKFELEDRDITELDNLSPQLALEFTELYISEYIIDRLMSELGKTLYDKEISQIEVIEREYEIREFVNGQVKLELDVLDFNGEGFSEAEGKKVMDDIFQLAYSILES